MALTEAYARAHFEARNVLDQTGHSPEQLLKAIRDIDRKNDNPGKFNIEIDQITSAILRPTGP